MHELGKTCVKVLVGKPEINKPLGRAAHRMILSKWVLRKYVGSF
jgi:hypothetical protein